jgi:hypothetical protein
MCEDEVEMQRNQLFRGYPTVFALLICIAVKQGFPEDNFVWRQVA